MSISLSKGQKVDLTKTNPGLKKVLVCLGWDANKYDGGADFDPDATVFLLGENGRVTNPTEDIVFYNNLKHVSGGVIHSGDERTGGAEGDDEVITVDFAKVPANIAKIDFVVTIFEAELRKQNFGQMSNSYARIVDADTGVEIARYDLGEDFSTETGVLVGQLYRNGKDWKFNAIGSGYNGGLASFCKDYGIDAQ